MRILYVHNEYGMWSGEETASEGLARLLTDHNHEVFWFRRSSRGLDTSVVAKAKAFCAGIYNPFSARDIARTLDVVRPDIVQVQNLYPWLSPSIFGPIRKRGIPTVMRCPNYRLFCPNGRHFIGGKLCEKCLCGGRELWCILRNCEDSLLKSTGYALRNAWARRTKSIQKGVDIFIVQTEFQKAKFVKNGIAPERIGILAGMAPHTDVCGNGNGHVRDVVLYVGRIGADKGIGSLLRAAETTPKVPISIAGDCSTSTHYRQSAPNNVRWLGFLTGKALLDLYCAARFVVVPSSCYEGFPNVIAVAMMMRKPVVSSRIGGIPEIVDDGVTGLLCEPGNARDLAEKIQYLWDRPDLCRQMGEAGREKALREYSPERCYERLMAIYEKALMLGPSRVGGTRFQ